MEKLCSNIANKIALDLDFDNDKKEVLAYGAFALLHMSFSIALVLIFGLIFNVAAEALIISFTASILRKYSGGAHASSPSACMFIGTILCIGQAVLVKLFLAPLINIKILLILGAVIFIWSYYIVFKLAPVDNPNKPIKREEKRRRMKKGSIIILSIYLIIAFIDVIIFLCFGGEGPIVYTECICTGVLWQAFTLTKFGFLTISNVDTLFNHIFNLKKEVKM
jgi:accessory gene regulator B